MRIRKSDLDGLPNIKRAVKQRMKELGITQRKISELTGWHQSSFNLLMQNNNWRVAELIVIGRILQMDLLGMFMPIKNDVPFEQYMQLEQQVKELERSLLSANSELKATYGNLTLAKQEIELLKSMSQKIVTDPMLPEHDSTKSKADPEVANDL